LRRGGWGIYKPVDAVQPLSSALAGDKSDMCGKPGLETGDISELLQQLGAIVWESFAGKWSVTFVSRDIQRALSLPQDQ
jgi:hypothetical protein